MNDAQDAEVRTVSVSPSFRRKPWVRALSVVLSVALAATMFDASSLRAAGEAFAMDGRAEQAGLSDEAPVGEGDQSGSNVGSEDPADSPQDDSSPDAEEGGEGVDGGAGAVSDPDASDDETQGDQSAESAGSTEEALPSADDGFADEPTEVDDTAEEEADEPTEADFLPEGLVEAASVLPRKPEGLAQADEAAKADPSFVAPADRVGLALSAYGSPQDAEGVFLAKGTHVRTRLDLGYLAKSLEGGHLGGAFEGDALALHIEAPYLYRGEAGEAVRTLSRETWMLHGGEESGARAALFSEGVPAGWSVWTEHDGAYLRRSDAGRERPCGAALRRRCRPSARVRCRCRVAAD